MALLAQPLLGESQGRLKVERTLLDIGSNAGPLERSRFRLALLS